MSKNFDKLLDICAKLRGPIGCPWDKSQTISSMLEHFAEEAEEVAMAIEKNDYPNLQEELGDLLFCMMLISQIAKEEKIFDIDDVLKGIEKKIISRHTWVFGKDKATTPAEAVAIWKKNKAKEKAQKARKVSRPQSGHKK